MKKFIKSRTGKLLLLALGLTLICGLALAILLNTRKPKEDDSTRKEEFPYKELFNENKNANEDYVGQIKFENGLLNQPIVKVANGLYKQDGSMYSFYSDSGKYVKPDTVDTNGCDGLPCDGNDVYLRLDWRTMEYDLLGSNFIDYRNTLDDKNIIVYGHHAYRSYFGSEEAEKMKFTKLDYLLDEENYESYKNFIFILDNEVRRYEIALVYKINVRDSEDLQVYRTDFNKDLDGKELKENYFNTWYTHAKEKQLYSTGVDLSASDNLLIISTCIENEVDGREIIVAKEIERTYYK